MTQIFNELSLHLSMLNNPIFFGIWGLLVGSFLNVLVYRLPKMMEQDWAQGFIDTLKDLEALKSIFPAHLAEKLFKANSEITYVSKDTIKNLSVPSSHCPQCGKKISWYENIPVLSWLLLKGRCSHCKTKISVQYPLVELITGICFTAMPLLGTNFSLIQNMVYTTLSAIFISLILIDYKKQLLPDLLLGWSLLGTLFIYSQNWAAISLEKGLLSGLICFGVLFLLSLAGKAWKGVAMMGDGDIKLVFILGLYISPLQIPYAFTLAFALFILQVLVVERSTDLKKSHPFGPALIVSFLALQSIITF